MKHKKRILRNQEGFTLVEIISVLVILGILAVVAIPKYMDITDDARKKAAVGQIAEVKGRLSVALSKFMLKNNGTTPLTGQALLDGLTAPLDCATTATTEGDFEFKCTPGSGKTVTVEVSKVQNVSITPAQSDVFTWQ